jgi:hypothetical protein
VVGTGFIGRARSMSIVEAVLHSSAMDHNRRQLVLTSH